jgi:hypothetical protein
MFARRRPAAEMASPFDSPIPFCYVHSVLIFRVFLTVQSFWSVLIWLEVWCSSFKIWDLGFVKRESLKALPLSKQRRLSHRACKSVKPSGLPRLTKKKLSIVGEVFEVILH